MHNRMWKGERVRAIRVSRLALVHGLLVLSACSSGGSPTAPVASQEVYGIAGIFALTEPQPRSQGPIQEVEVLLDGKRVITRSFTPGASIVYFSLPDQFIQPGAHELAIRVVRQSVSPNEYMAVGGVAVMNMASRHVQQFNWPRGSSFLQTGDAISMRFTVNTQ